MKVKIEKSIARGHLVPPSSKSMAHRLIISAALSCEKTRISGVTFSEDISATLDCLSALGMKYSVSDSSVFIEGFDIKSASASGELFCRESGSTLRFLIPLALLTGEEITLVGAPRLMERPMGVYEDLCRERGFLFKREDGKITVKGKLFAGEYSLPGNISSQFITGLLFALSALRGDSKIKLTTAIESRSYIDLTIYAMHKFGVDITWENEQTLYIKGGQRYRASGDIFTEGDYSGAAFPDAFNYIGGKVEITGLEPDSLQGDRVYREHFKSLAESSPTIDITDCPDLGPILFTMAALLNGATLSGTRRLRIKESDRASVMAAELSKFGADITVLENSVIINKKELHAPCEPLLGHNDHRIVMSLAVIASVFGGEIEGAEAVAKSYPSFFSDIEMLGIKVKRYENN